MNLLTAVAHILGAVIALFAFGAATFALAAWEAKRNQTAGAEEISIALGIPVARLEDPEHAQRIVQFSAARFSTDLFRNRLSDLCGVFQTVWGWMGALLQIGLLAGVIWYAIVDDATNAVHAWWTVAIAIFCWIASVAFSLLCKLLTGRFPGQAKQARKSLAKFVSSRNGGEFRER
jgi:hypothetical protein